MPHPRAIGAVLAALLLAPPASAEPLEIRVLSSPSALRDLAPGDTAEWAAEVTGTSDDLSVGVAVDGSDAFATDPETGLLLTVDVCSSPFSVVERTIGTRTIERYLCPGEQLALGSGPAATLGTLDGIRPRGATTGIRVHIHFPRAAGNEVENSRASLRVTVTETAASGAAGPTPLAVTGTDVGAALLGGLLALGGGALLGAIGRRRRA